MVASNTAFQQAIEAHRGGKLNQAESYYLLAMDQTAGDPACRYAYAILKLSQGNHEKGVELLQQVIKQAPDLYQAHYQLGCAYTWMGDSDNAVKHFVQFLKVDLDARNTIPKEADLEIRYNMYKALTHYDPHLAYIYRSCPILSAYKGSATDIIKSNLDTHISKWERGVIPSPEFQDFAVSRALSEVDIKKVKVLSIFTRYVMSSTDYVEGVLYGYFTKSALQLGMQVDYFPADIINYDFGPGRKTLEQVQQKLAELTQRIEHYRPDVIVFDGNFAPTPLTISPQYWRDLKSRVPFKLITFMGDLYDMQVNLLEHWGPVSDRVCYAHPWSKHLREYPDKDKLLWLPCPPYERNMIDQAPKERLTDLICMGTNARARDPFLTYAQKYFQGTDVKLNINLHDREKKQTLLIEEYIRQHATSKMCFTSGYHSPDCLILTNRIFEAIMLGTLAIDEFGSPLDRMFVPFIHYIPVISGNQLVHYIEFFKHHEDYRSYITKQAFKHFNDHYESRWIWGLMLQGLDLNLN